MLANYEESLHRLLLSEGGYTNHPSDPGGPTNFGITLVDAQKYAAEFHWIVGRKVTAADVKAMPLWFAKMVYDAKYWDSLRCDELPHGVDYAVFDYGVNSGIGRSGKVLRRVLGVSDSTYVVSDSVIAAVRLVGPEKVINAICDERLRFLKNLKTWPVFGGGWTGGGATEGAVRRFFAITLSNFSASFSSFQSISLSSAISISGWRGEIPSVTSFSPTISVYSPMSGIAALIFSMMSGSKSGRCFIFCRT